MKKNKIKQNGEVFTPRHIVLNMLDFIGYDNEEIINKHIIDNSAGDGAFLKEIVERYINIAKLKKISTIQIRKNIEKYIHGIELDKSNFDKLIFNLNKICSKQKIYDVAWDILNENSLSVKKFTGKMDYVVGNPPYVRVHNLRENYEDIKAFSFSKKGMTDLFIVFFEIGFKMLNKTGKMSYISPTSWWTSVAGEPLRKYITNKHNLSKIINLGHYQAFNNVTTYTCISLFENNERFNSIDYSEYQNMNKIIKIPYQDIFIDNKIYFSKINGLLKKILSSGINKHAICKNGYATLNDNVFIKDNFPDEIQPLIRVLKGSTGKYKFCIYPYNKDGKLIGFDMLNNNTREYLEKNLKKDRTDWFGFGRTQALKDTYKNKIAISSLIKSKDSLKIKKLEKGEGVYSGLYIITDKEFSQIQKALINPIFVKFVESLRKYKNGGFYTFNTSDVTKYLNYYFENGGINE